jgi:peptidylprolyl isomerase
MTAQHGDSVKVQYWGATADGAAIGSDQDNEPITFTIGKGQVIAGLEEAVLGMRTGEEKTAVIPMDKAFGRRDDGNVVTVKRDRLPSGLSLHVGKQVCLKTEDGRRAVFAVADVFGASVALSANHPLSGKDIILRIRLLEIMR